MDNSPDLSESDREQLKSLGKIALRNLYSWLYGQTWDWEELFNATDQNFKNQFDVGSNFSDSEHVNLYVLYSNSTASIWSGRNDGFESAFRKFHSWIETAPHLSEEDKNFGRNLR